MAKSPAIEYISEAISASASALATSYVRPRAHLICTKKVCIRSRPLFAVLFCNNFDVAVHPCLDLERRLEDLGFVARDYDVLAFGEDERGKRADQLADDVAPRREHREGGVGEGLADGFIDELERQRRTAMADCDVDPLAGRDFYVGVDHRIGRDRRWRDGRRRFAGIGWRADPGV